MGTKHTTLVPTRSHNRIVSINLGIVVGLATCTSMRKVYCCARGYVFQRYTLNGEMLYDGNKIEGKKKF